MPSLKSYDAFSALRKAALVDKEGGDARAIASFHGEEKRVYPRPESGWSDSLPPRKDSPIQTIFFLPWIPEVRTRGLRQFPSSYRR